MILYKYISADRKDILRDSQIRFTQYYDQNDPYECSVSLLPLERETQAAVEDDYLGERAEVETQFRNKFFQFGMLCLTKNRQNLLMWSHYAQNHKGLVLGFDIKNSFFNSEESFTDFAFNLKKKFPVEGFGTIRPVEYLKKRKQVNYGHSVSIHDILFTKSFHWEYEQEFRILKSILNIEPAKQLSTGEKIYLIRFPKDCLKEVIFGLDTEESNKKEVEKLNETIYDSNITLRQAKLKHLDFGIEIEP